MKEPWKSDCVSHLDGFVINDLAKIATVYVPHLIYDFFNYGKGIKVFGLRQGVWIHDQNRHRTCWMNGLEHGVQQKWHPNGKLQYKRNMCNGKPHGLVEWWHKNGQQEYKCNHVHGKSIGREQLWNLRGELINEVHYDPIRSTT